MWKERAKKTIVVILLTTTATIIIKLDKDSSWGSPDAIG